MSIIEFIQDRARYYNCPVCGRNLKGCEVRMLNHVEDRFTVQVTCATCHVTFIVILAIQGQGLEMVQEGDVEVEVEVHDLREDLQIGDAAGGHERGPIELDELLDVHLVLRGYDGPLTDLLKQPEQPRK
ncbi:MAG: hypothetical protein ABI838_08820 [Chloroflexota bacterium]